MRVHDHIRTPPSLIKRHVYLGNYNSHHSFLAVSGAELITYLRNSNLASDQLDSEQVFVSLTHNDFISKWGQFSVVFCWFVSILFVFSRVLRDLLVHVNITVFNSWANSQNSVLFKIHSYSELFGKIFLLFNKWRLNNSIIISSKGHILISSHIHDSSIASIDTRLVKNNSVFNIIARITHDGHLSILTCWKFVPVDQINCFWLN